MVLLSPETAADGIVFLGKNLENQGDNKRATFPVPLKNLLVFIFNQNASKNAIEYLLISGLIFFRDYS